jgi:hypothetical protein
MHLTDPVPLSASLKHYLHEVIIAMMLRVCEKILPKRMISEILRKFCPKLITSTLNWRYCTVLSFGKDINACNGLILNVRDNKKLALKVC